jgi:hypothetical protein
MDKFFLRSKTIWGALIMLVNPTLSMFGIDSLPADQLASLSDHVLAAMDNLSTIVGLVLVIYGRFTAKDNVKALPKLGG